MGLGFGVRVFRVYRRGLIGFILVFGGFQVKFNGIGLAAVLLKFCPRGANFSSVS